MGYRHDLPEKTERRFEKKHSPLSSRFVYPEVTPPPSYHSFEGFRPNQATGPAASVDTEVRKRAREHGTVSQHPMSRNEELVVNRRPRRDHRKHHRRRSSSSSHKSSWTAKLVFQGLRSSLLGSSSPDHTRRETSREQSTSQTTRLDFSTTSRDIHYTVHNHWYETSSSNPPSRTKTWPGRQPARPATHPFAHLMSGALPTFVSDEHFVLQGVTGRPLCQEHQRPFGCLFSGVSSQMPDEIDAGSPFEEIFDTFSPYPGDARAYARAAHDVWWRDQSEAQQAFANGPGRCSHDFISNGDPASRLPFGMNGSRGYDRESDSSHERRDSSNPHDSHHSSHVAGCQLAAYNKRWDYLDTVQHPFPHELPWPAMRHDVSFDHMKCDVFVFFARGCKLQPDRSKAPKLDFTLPPRSPYPSYDQRQQEWARKMLKVFKRQMQREKLRWHEDKLRRKFPEAIEKDDERRKAVWAAIAEGSAVCEKRLGSML
jgi:hypothetical protein